MSVNKVLKQKIIEDVSSYLAKKNKDYPIQDWYKKCKKQIFIFDCGGRKSEFFVLDVQKKQCFLMSKKDFLNFPKENPDSIFIIEYAHLETRKVLSLAQPLTMEEKNCFYKNCQDSNISLKFFPERQTPKARTFAEHHFNPDLNKKSERVDVISIFFYLKHCPNIFKTLSSDDSRHTPVVDEAKEFRDTTNEILNVARSCGYKNDSIADFIEKNKVNLFQKLSADTKNIFGIRICKNNKNKIKNIEQYKHVYTILSTLLDREGNKRIRKHTGESPGWKFVRNRDFCFNPLRGGVSKSNLNFHFVKNYIIKEMKKQGLNIEKNKKIAKLTKIEDKIFKNERKKVNKAIKEIFLYCQKIIMNKI